MPKYVILTGANEPTSVHYEGGCGDVHVAGKDGRIEVCDKCAVAAEAALDHVVEEGAKKADKKADEA